MTGVIEEVSDLLNYSLVMKKKMFYVYALILLLTSYFSYLFRKFMGLPTNIFAILIPMAIGFAIVWWYGRSRNRIKKQ